MAGLVQRWKTGDCLVQVRATFIFGNTPWDFFGPSHISKSSFHPQLVRGPCAKFSRGLPIYRFGSSFWGEAFAGHHTSDSFHAVLTACAAGVSWRRVLTKPNDPSGQSIQSDLTKASVKFPKHLSYSDCSASIIWKALDNCWWGLVVNHPFFF